MRVHRLEVPKPKRHLMVMALFSAAAAAAVVYPNEVWGHWISLIGNALWLSEE